MRQPQLVSVLFIATLVGFVGCKAKEAPPSGFLGTGEQMSRDKTTPFHRTYWNAKYEKSQYTEVMIAPVDTHYVLAQNFWEKANIANVSEEQIRDDVAKLADYTRNSFVRAFADDPNKRFTLVETAGPKTLILELALVQVVPSKAVLNALGYVTWVPTAVSLTGATATDSPDTGKGYVAIEGRVRDGASGEIIGMFADRESPATAIVDLKALTWWAPAKSIVDHWAKQLVALANRRPGEVVKDTPAFELLIW